MQLESFGNRLRIVLEDDGRGIDVAHIAAVAIHRGLLSEKETRERSTEEIARMIFQPGFSTSKIVTEVSGRGMGLSVVFEAVTRLQGEVQLTHKPSPGTSLLISVPLSISTHRLLLITSGGQTFAIPLHAVETLMRLKVENIQTVEGKPIVSIQKELVPLVSMAHLLEIDDADFHVEGDYLLVAILRTGTRRLAVGVDAFVAERDCLIHDLEGPATAVPRFAGGILLDDGQVALVLNPTEVIDCYDRLTGSWPLSRYRARPSKNVGEFSSLTIRSPPELWKRTCWKPTVTTFASLSTGSKHWPPWRGMKPGSTWLLRISKCHDSTALGYWKRSRKIPAYPPRPSFL